MRVCEPRLRVEQTESIPPLSFQPLDLIPRQEQRTALLFWALCAYLLAQACTIPLRAVGPWAMWPTLPDLMFGGLILAFGLNFRHCAPASSANRKILGLLGVIWLGCVLSYLGYWATASSELAGVKLGQYQIYRLTQTILLFGVVAQIPLSQRRLRVLHTLATGVLLLSCLGVLLTFAGVVPLPLITAHLPQDKGVAGPWSFFSSIAEYGNKGWGTLGYNHAYNSAQILLLLGFRVHLGQTFRRWGSTDTLMLVLAIVTCFVTESRAGFAACILLGGLYLARRPQALVQMLVLLLCLLTLTFTLMPSAQLSGLDSAEGSVLERQTKLLEASDTDNLSGRDDLWGQKLRYLDAQPLRWVLGGGYGCAWDSSDSGESAHMLLLQVLLETGMVGVGIFSLLFYKILTSLYRYEGSGRPFFWLTLTLLFASATQETFYPIPAMLGFLGFYFSSLAIALRPMP
jgi:hypothetical protein